MTDFFNEGGVFLGSGAAPVRPETGKDLGEFGSDDAGAGFAPGNTIAILPPDYNTRDQFWGRAGGVISPILLGDKVAVGSYINLYDEKLYVNGKILSTGYMLSQTSYITEDGSGNMVFTDTVAGSATLLQLLSNGTGNVVSDASAGVGKLAIWMIDGTLGGIDISALVLTQSQITGLVTALAGKANKVHNLVDTVNHPVTGLTPGHFLKALSPTTYGFTTHGLTKTDIGLSNITNDAQVKKISASTNLAIARWDGTTGDLLKDSLSTLGDDGSIDIPLGAFYKINGVPIVVSGGATPTDNILDWDAANSWYAPYAAKAAGKFDSGSVMPSNTTRLNYDGNFYATNFYLPAGGYVRTPDGHLQHLTIAAGAASGATNDGGNLILRAGNAILADNASSKGDIYLVPGNAFQSTTASSVYLGDAGYICELITLRTTGTQATTDLYIWPNGMLVLGQASYTLSIYANSMFINSSPIIVGDLSFQGGNKFIQGAELYHGAGYSLTVRGGPGWFEADHNGGDLLLHGGTPAGTGITGKIYIGTGSAGTNSLAGSGTGTSIILYNRATGEITYGDGAVGSFLPLSGGTVTGTLIINDAGSAACDFRVESDTEENMLYLDADGDTNGALYFGGTTNGIKINKGGVFNLLGTARVTQKKIISLDALGCGVSAPSIVRLGNYVGYEYDIGDDSYFSFEPPEVWDSTTGIIVKIYWYVDEAYADHSAEVNWQALYSCTPDDGSEAIDAPTHSGTLTTGDINVPAIAKSIQESTFTVPAAHIGVDDIIGIHFSRINLTAGTNPTHAKPTIIRVEFYYTANKLGNAT